MSDPVRSYLQDSDDARASAEEASRIARTAAQQAIDDLGIGIARGERALRSLVRLQERGQEMLDSGTLGEADLGSVRILRDMQAAASRDLEGSLDRLKEMHAVLTPFLS